VNLRKMGVFKSKLVRPERIATDTVLPLHPMDDTSVNKSFVLYLMLRFDDVLDPERLRSSLETLLEHGNWRKLGARLRLNVGTPLHTSKEKLELCYGDYRLSVLML
jgi:hypothetical protein